MKKELDVVFILDKSGSMSGSEENTISSFNEYLEKEKKNKFKTNITTVVFSNDYEYLYRRENVKGIQKLTDKEYFVGGCTALYDALGNSIHDIEKEKPNKAIFIIITDGYENASISYTKEQIKESPEYGASFQSPYLNSIFRGIYGFILRAAKSGGGKTIMSLGDLCKVTCTEYWDFQKEKFVKNKSRVGAGLFINTEMDMRKELDPIIISWISGVKRDHILDGFYLAGEEERVNYAANVLSNSEFYIVDDPCFTTKSLVNTIREYATLKQVKTICFDYIQNNGYVASEIANETKVPQREDMVLLALTDRLKQIQRQCNVGLISAVQTNGQEDNMNFPTESCLAGSKAQVRKTDGTMAMLPPKKAELEIFDMIKGNNSLKIPEDAICNNITHIIKGRSSKFPKYIKIFQYVDYGNSRCYDWCVTDKDGALIKIDKLLIEYDGRKII